MELRQFKYFIKAKELLNFTAAAEQLFISQSTLSQQIKQLEQELGVPLFNRIGKRIEITEAGNLFYEYALQSISRAESGLLLLRDLNNLSTGELLIGVTYGLRYLLTDALIDFLKEFPKIKVQIVFGTSQELKEKMLHLQLDFVLSFEEMVYDKQLNYSFLFASPLGLVCSIHSKLARKKEVSLKEVMGLPLVLPSNGFSTREFINNIISSERLSPEIVVEINDIPTLLELIETGNWYSILTKTTVDKDEQLCIIPITGKKMNRKAMIISMKDVYEKKAARYFCDLILLKATETKKGK